MKDAFFSPDRVYRYSLLRIWNQEKPTACFIGLNPSTADEKVDDPTIRRCINYAISWGYGSIVMVNLFAYRATNPDELGVAHKPVGPANMKYIINATNKCELTVCCWGTLGNLHGQDRHVLPILKKPHYLKLTKGGFPSHPLYLKSNLTPKLFLWKNR
jgi:hypothetical protein